MATRFYVASAGTPAVTPTMNNGGEWEHVNTDVRFPLKRNLGATALANTAYNPDAADHVPDADALLAQLVGDDMLAAQTINAQTVSWQFQALESNAGNNVALAIKIFVVGIDGTIKETLLAIRRDATEMATAITNRSDSATIASATIEHGDRICVEAGCGGDPVATGGVQGHNCTIRFGEDASSGDLPVNDTETGTTFRPWIEFAENLVFVAPAIDDDGAWWSGSAPKSGATLAAGVAAAAACLSAQIANLPHYQDEIATPPEVVPMGGGGVRQVLPPAGSVRFFALGDDLPVLAVDEEHPAPIARSSNESRVPLPLGADDDLPVAAPPPVVLDEETGAVLFFAKTYAQALLPAWFYGAADEAPAAAVTIEGGGAGAAIKVAAPLGSVRYLISGDDQPTAAAPAPIVDDETPAPITRPQAGALRAVTLFDSGDWVAPPAGPGVPDDDSFAQIRRQSTYEQSIIAPWDFGGAQDDTASPFIGTDEDYNVRTWLPRPVTPLPPPRVYIDDVLDAANLVAPPPPVIGGGAAPAGRRLQSPSGSIRYVSLGDDFVEQAPVVPLPVDETYPVSWLPRPVTPLKPYSPRIDDSDQPQLKVGPPEEAYPPPYPPQKVWTTRGFTPGDAGEWVAPPNFINVDEAYDVRLWLPRPDRQLRIIRSVQDDSDTPPLFPSLGITEDYEVRLLLPRPIVHLPPPRIFTDPGSDDFEREPQFDEDYWQNPVRPIGATILRPPVPWNEQEWVVYIPPTYTYKFRDESGPVYVFRDESGHLYYFQDESGQP